MIRSALVLLLALSAIGALAPCAHARGGGGCLAGGTAVATPEGPRAVETLKRGDAVLAADGRVVRVVDTVRVDSERFVELRAGGRSVRFTPEHLVQTAPGVFRQAGVLKAGDPVVTAAGPARVERTRLIESEAPAFNLTAGSPQTFFAGGMAVHNKGCFLPDTAVLVAEGRSAPISSLKAGDRLLAHTPDGRTVTTTVREVFTVVEPTYFEIEAGDVGVKATAEHPFYVGDGTYRTVSALKPGDTVYLFDGKALVPRKITVMREKAGPVTVYNLRTDHPNSFFANGFAVHNKGGGCFVAGTPVLTSYGKAAIEDLHPGESVLAFGHDGRVVPARVREVYSLVSTEVYELRADGQTALASAEHPFYTGAGVFKMVAELSAGETIYHLDGYKLAPVRVDSVRLLAGSQRVYNLRVDAPNTFFAGGLAVHNKGGGGGGRGGGGKSCPRGDTVCEVLSYGILVFLVGGYVFLIAYEKFVGPIGSGEDLDYSFPRALVNKKAGRTRKLLEFLAKSDRDMAPDPLMERAKTVFLKMQECWQARDEYGPMEKLLMPALYREHLGQLAGLARAHEVDKIENVKVHFIEPVHVRYPHDREKREVCMLIEAEAKDWYMDDRTGEYLRGDEEPATFQEFWTFQWEKDVWVLRSIEQTRESDALREENFVETFTPDQLSQVYGEPAGVAVGPTGNWRDAALEGKENRIHRLLNFLVKTDKAWDEDAMKERTRETFMAVQSALEEGKADGTKALLTGAAYESLARDIDTRRKGGLQLLQRNLCVRKVDILLVRNAADNGRDEFVARVAAHAQKTVLKGGTTVFQQEYVTPFEEYWTFGREQGSWRLRESLPPAQAQDVVASENVYQEASADQLQWMYTKDRAL